MTIDIEQLRNNLQTNAKKAPENTIKTDSPYFPFWKMEVGQSVTLRLFPDNDTSNILPFIERRTVQLPFDGVVGGREMETVVVEVPSLTTWDTRAKDPIVEGTRKYWDAKGADTNVPLARAYHYKRNFLYQGLVVGGDLIDAGRENDVRVFSFNKQLHETIVAFMMDPDLEHAPFDPEHGRDLTITKGKQGEFANYTAKFSMKERALSEVESGAMLNSFTLESLLPEPVSADTMTELFEASLASEAFDTERFKGFYYRKAPHAKLAVDLRK